MVRTSKIKIRAYIKTPVNLSGRHKVERIIAATFQSTRTEDTQHEKGHRKESTQPPLAIAIAFIV